MRLLVLVLILFLSPAFAQNEGVSGRITDISQAMVPSATVEILNTKTGILNRTTSNNEGFFMFPPR